MILYWGNEVPEGAGPFTTENAESAQTALTVQFNVQNQMGPDQFNNQKTNAT